MIKPKVIAETSINHQSDYPTLVQLADMAMECGADYVKLQLRTPKECVPQEQWDIPKRLPDGKTVSYIEYRELFEFDEAQLASFDQYMIENYGQHKWSASVFDVSSLHRLMLFDVPWIKIPSAMLTNRKLIQECTKTKKPLIISTGMSSERQVETMMSWLPIGYDIRLMHCHSAYPSPEEEMSLSTIETLKKKFGVPVGWSHHHQSPFPAIYSYFYGASFIEVHVTLSRSLPGSDHASSLEKPGLSLLIRELNRIERIEGNGEIVLHDSELPALRKLRGNGGY